MSFTWQAGEVLEDDGVADFKLQKKEEPSGSFADVTTWLPDSTSLATIDNLKTGTKYSFALLRKTLSGGASSQAIVEVTTKTSALVVSGTASSTIQVNWESLYANAQYLIVYTPEGGSAMTFNDGPITTTMALLTNLESDTNYTVELYVIEGGVPVGIATEALGSAISAKTTPNYMLIGGVTAVATVPTVGVVVLVIKMKKAKALASALV